MHTLTLMNPYVKSVAAEILNKVKSIQ